MDSPKFGWGHVNMSKSQTIDSTYLTITYAMKRRMSAQEDTLKGEDLLELQMGRKFNAFFSKALREVDIINTRDMMKKMYIKPHPEGCLGLSLIFDHSSKTLKVDNRLPYSSNIMEYEEPIPQTEWKYLPDTMRVMGYLCHAAESSFGGREWKVYYTDDIPLPYGPWKLNGSKGLILRAGDKEGDYIFEAVGLTQQPQPILRYEWKRKETTKDEYLKYERNIHEKAGVYIRNNGIRIRINDNSEKGAHKLVEDWEAYYNPLEKQ